jgi:geranylgeranyl diphosphate synthase, type II
LVVEMTLVPMSPRRGAGSATDLQAWMEARRLEIDAALPSLLPARREMASSVHDAIAYALMSPGKRIRPTLTLAVGEIYRLDGRRLMPAACAMEMVHTSSLILDDLPCMDDAPTRRGRKSCHVAYGEATAVLAAVGLLNQAFAILAGEGCSDGTRDRLRTIVARRVAAAIGPEGVIGGQAADLEAARSAAAGARRAPTLEQLEFIHARKTGSLFIASVELGAVLAGAPQEEEGALSAYAKNLGLAFQITDDLIDAVGSEAEAGKPVRSDAGKATFVALCGVEGARTLASDLIESALACLAPFGRRGHRLNELARFVETRQR